MSNEPQQKKDIGALWVKTSKNGVEYMSGKIEIDGVTHELTIFANKYKDSDNKPTWKIYPSEPRGEAAKPVAPQRQAAPQQARGVNPAPQRAPLPGRNQPAQRQAPPRREAPPAQDFGDDQDIPF